MNRILLIFLSIAFLACAEEETQAQLRSIKYGSSFGECQGYCLTDIEITPVQITKVRYGWNNSVTPETTTLQFRNANFFDLERKIDQQRFLDLEPVIGCPDCADGGSEWIELEIDGRFKKVTIEYGTEISGINEILVELRGLNMTLSN